MDIINYLKRLEKNLNTLSPFEYTDDYRLTVTPGATLTIHDDSMVAPEEKEYYREIIATVLAKSVALEKIETEIDILFDDIEDVVDFLAQGHLNISDEKLARISAKILGFKYNTLSYIMLLDKPEITWTNAHAKELFTQLSDLFELVERYEKIGHKSQTLMDITEVFAGLAHNKRSTRLEWAVIILIGIEIVLSVIDMFLK